MSPAKSTKPKTVKPSIAAQAAVAPEAQAVPTPAEAAAAAPELPVTVSTETTPAAKPPVAPATDLNHPGFPLHPERVWPD